VKGPLNLNIAKLTLTEANLFAPTVGQTFTIINTSGAGNTISGQFVQGSTITSQGTTYSITYNPTSVVLTVTAVPTATQLVLISPVIPPGGLTETAGHAFTFAVQAQDATGNPAGGYSGTLNVVDSAGGLSFIPSVLTMVNSSVTAQATATKAGTNTLLISSTGSNGNGNLTVGPSTPTPVQFTVLADVLVKANVTILPSGNVSAGNAFLILIQAADAFGNASSIYSGPLFFNANLIPPTSSPGLSNFPINNVAINSNGQGLALGTIDQVGTYKVVVADTSTGTLTGTSSTPVVVVPGAPAKLAFDPAAQPHDTPTGVKLPAVKVDVTDAYGNLVTSDNTDVVTLSVGSGPAGGIFQGGSTLTATAVNGVATFNNLTLVVPGTYTLNAVVAGKYTGPFSSAFAVAPLQVTPGSFSSSPTGFSVSFNAPFLVTSTTPVLYGRSFGLGSGGSGQPPTVILTSDGADLNDAAAYVPGTVVLNTATNSLQFVETDTTNALNNGTPILPDGVYTAVIRGMNNVSPNGLKYNGLQALNAGGGFLDGTNAGTPGHDFTATFTVGAAAAHDDVVWVPATADEPEEPLNAPGNNTQMLFSGGFPVYLDDMTGNVTSVTGTFSYNPTLLTVAGGTSNGGLPGSTFTVNVTKAGTATFTYTDATGANKSKLVGGVGSSNALIPAGAISAPALGFIRATVPNSSTTTPIYKAKDVLTVSDVQINGSGATPVVGGSAVHLVAFVGDADGNGAYNSADAVLITRALLSTDSGFVAYPLVDPVIAADTDGSGFIPADAALQINELGVGPIMPLAVPPIPPPPFGPNVAPIGNNVDPALTVEREAWTVDRSTVTVAVNLDDAHPAGSTGLIRGHLALTYDPNVFAVSAADVHPGSLLAGGDWKIVPTIDQVTGQIGIALSSTTPITSTKGGSLVTIDFHAAAGNANPSFIALVSFVTPNGQFITTELEDDQGTFTLTQGNTVVMLTNTGAMLPAPMAQVLVHESETVTIEPSSHSHEDSPAIVETGSGTAAVIMTPVAEAALLHVAGAAGHGAAAIVAAMDSSLTAVALTGLVLQLAGMPLAAGSASAALGWQHLADELFQALARTTSSAGDMALGSVVPNLEHGLGGQLLLAQPSSEDMDSFYWAAVGSALDWQSATRESLRSTRDQRDTRMCVTTPAAEVVRTRAALDQLFSQDADNADLPGENE
jgi:Cohesin domain